jgi:hypothetical protein
MELNALKLKDLRNEEHSQFHLDFKGLVNQFTVNTLGIETLYPAYQTAFDLEVTALNVVQASAVTSDLFVADSERDNTASGLTGTIKSALNHFDPEVRSAANRLMLLLDTYGNLAIKPYDQETASITKLVSELEGSYAADVATLGVGGWVAELKARNNAFDSLKNQRYSENSSKPQQNLKMARQETDTTYRAVVKRINALIEVNGDTAYAGFVNALNQRIEHYQLVLAQRQGRNAKDKDKEGDSNSGGEDAPKK